MAPRFSPRGNLILLAALLVVCAFAVTACFGEEGEGNRSQRTEDALSEAGKLCGAGKVRSINLTASGELDQVACR